MQPTGDHRALRPATVYKVGITLFRHKQNSVSGRIVSRISLRYAMDNTKNSDACPTLSLNRLAHHLVDGKIAREDAVILWDRPLDDEAAPVRNVAVGFFPKNDLSGLPHNDPDRLAWKTWNRQWTHCHGLPLVHGEAGTGGAMPEGIVAFWIVAGLNGQELKDALRHIQERVAEFSLRRVDDFVEQLRQEREGEVNE